MRAHLRSARSLGFNCLRVSLHGWNGRHVLLVLLMAHPRCRSSLSLTFAGLGSNKRRSALRPSARALAQWFVYKNTAFSSGRGRNACSQRVVATRGRSAWSQGVVATRGRYARSQRAVAARGRNARPQRVVAARGRNAWPQRVVATRGCDARSQRVVATRGRKARPQRAVAARGPNAGSQRVVATRGRNARSQRAAATRGRNANQGRQKACFTESPSETPNLGRQKACFTGRPKRNAQPGPAEGLFYRKLQAKRPTWAGRRPVSQEAPSETPKLGRQTACFTGSSQRNAQPGPAEGVFYKKLQAKHPTWGRQKACFTRAPAQPQID